MKPFFEYNHVFLLRIGEHWKWFGVGQRSELGVTWNAKIKVGDRVFIALNIHVLDNSMICMNWASYWYIWLSGDMENTLYRVVATSYIHLSEAYIHCWHGWIGNFIRKKSHQKLPICSSSFESTAIFVNQSRGGLVSWIMKFCWGPFNRAHDVGSHNGRASKLLERIGSIWCHFLSNKISDPYISIV